MENYQYVGCVMAVQAENSGLPAMLLPNATVQADPEHPYVKRLVARKLLVEMPSACQPTSLSFIPQVTLPDTKTRVMLRATLEVNGVAEFNTDITVKQADLDAYTQVYGQNYKTPEGIAESLFLNSGVALFPTYNLDKYFDYTHGHLTVNQPILIEGRASDTSLLYATKSINLILKLIDNLPDDAVDFVKEQWGHDVTVHSCAANQQINDGNLSTM